MNPPPSPPTTFTCASCGGTFPLARPDEEAVAECKEEFGLSPREAPCVVFCDPCYQRFMRYYKRIQRNN